MGVLQDGKWQNANSWQHGLADVRAATLKGFAAGDVVTPALRLKSYKTYFFFSFRVHKWYHWDYSYIHTGGSCQLTSSSVLCHLALVVVIVISLVPYSSPKCFGSSHRPRSLFFLHDSQLLASVKLFFFITVVITSPK